MMVATDVEYIRAVDAARKQNFVAAGRMRFDDIELSVGELAGLVQHFLRHDRLADVVQQARHARAVAGGLIEPELPSHRYHQCTDRHGVHVRVLIGRLQAAETDQCVGVTPHGCHDLIHQRAALAGIHGIAHARRGEQGRHRLFRSLQDAGGRVQFVGD